MAEKPAEQTPLPEVTFSAFVMSLASAVLVQLGEVRDPSTGQLTPNRELAKHGIDTLSMLEQKISNGLNPDERSLIDSVLYELKMKYVCQGKKA